MKCFPLLNCPNFAPFLELKKTLNINSNDESAGQELGRPL